MGRPRKNANAHLPQHVHIRNSSYYFVRDGVWTRLAPLGCAEGELELAIAKHKGAKVGAAPRAASADIVSLVDLIDRALPVICAQVSERTKQNYGYTAETLRQLFPTATIGEVDAPTINDLKQKPYMQKHPAVFNHCRSLLKSVLDWGLLNRKGDMKTNPVLSVPPCEVPPRSRLLEQHEFDAIYTAARERERVVMLLCYLTTQRIRDVLSMRESHITEAGVMCMPSKTKKHGKRILNEWTPELREAIERARALRRSPLAAGEDGWLLQGVGARCLQYGAFRAQWVKACERAGIEDAHIHDIRAKSATDIEEEGGLEGEVRANRSLGHTSMATSRRYLRSRRAVKVQGPSGRGKPALATAE